MLQESVRVTARAKKRIHKNPHPLPKGEGGRRQRPGEGVARCGCTETCRAPCGAQGERPAPARRTSARHGLALLATARLRRATYGGPWREPWEEGQ